MASVFKKPKLECSEMSCSSISENKGISNTKKTEIAVAFDKLCFPSPPCVILRPLKIINCNAACSTGEKSFKKSYCSVDCLDKKFLFGDIFRRGLDILTAYLEKNQWPENNQEHFVLGKLLSFIDSASDDLLPTTELDDLNQTELSTLLANHVFGKLATSPKYVIDQSMIHRRMDDCLCGRKNCKLTGVYGDTCIGNGEVWHGNLDIVINNELPVYIQPSKEDTDGENFKSYAIVNSSNLSKNPKIIAQTIVFSFLQKQTHPEKDFFLTPCIGVEKSHMTVSFYDSEHDVLLESSGIPLLCKTNDDGSEKLSLVAVLVSWLVANYKYLCSGITDEMKHVDKADFFKHAKDKLEIYENRLTLGNVGTTPRSDKKRKKQDVIFCSRYLFHKHEQLSKLIYNNN